MVHIFVVHNFRDTANVTIFVICPWTNTNQSTTCIIITLTKFKDIIILYNGNPLATFKDIIMLCIIFNRDV